MIRPLALSLCLFMALAGPASAITIYDESVDGDLSGVPSSPDALAVSVGANTVIGSVGQNGGTGATNGSDADYFSITIGAGESLTALTIDSYTFAPSNPGASFIGIVAGDGFSGQGGGSVDNFVLFNALSADVLPGLAGGPLGEGTYSFWVQEVSPTVVDYQLTATVVPEPSTALFVGLGLCGLAARARRA